MKTKLTLFRRNGIYYSQDATTGQQKSLGTRDQTIARNLIAATNEAHHSPTLNRAHLDTTPGTPPSGGRAVANPRAAA